jgi:hypothetical protein
VSGPVEIGAAGVASSSDAPTNGDAGSARVAVSSRPRGNAWASGGRAYFGGHVSAIRVWLRQGQLLSEHVWRRRHKTIVALLWLHVFGLSVYGLFRGYGGLHVLLDAIPVALAAAAAGSEGAGLRVRVAAASFGLISSSAMLVHLSGGAIEAHFHFFVMIGVLTLYQDWLPFLLAIGYSSSIMACSGCWRPRASTTIPRPSRDLRTIADETDAAVLMLHHERKPQAGQTRDTGRR